MLDWIKKLFDKDIMVYPIITMIMIILSGFLFLISSKVFGLVSSLIFVVGLIGTLIEAINRTMYK